MRFQQHAPRSRFDLAGKSTALKRVGERLPLGAALEVVVLDLTGEHVKLGIRSLRDVPDRTPPVACRGRGSAYYHSQGGVTMLVVSPASGQRLEVNESVDLSVDELTPNGVRLSTRATGTNTSLADEQFGVSVAEFAENLGRREYS